MSLLISWFVCLQAGCSDVEGTICSRDSDCGCFGLYLCLQNTCKSAVSDVGKLSKLSNFVTIELHIYTVHVP